MPNNTRSFNEEGQWSSSIADTLFKLELKSLKIAKEINVSEKSAAITTETQVHNEYRTPKAFSHQVDIESWEGKKDLEFWSWGYEYLYNVHTSLISYDKVLDKVTTLTSFRKTEIDNGMFKLKDRMLHLKGYAQRSTNEWPELDSAVPSWLSEVSNELDVESLGRLGILQALPAGDNEGDVTGRHCEQRIGILRDAIIYNRNNPSEIFYESEIFDITEDQMTQMKDLRDTFYPYGGRAIGSREMLGSKAAEYGGEMLYINKGARIPFWQMEYSRDEGLRKSYNRNQDSHAIENVERWFDYYEQRPGTGTRVNTGGVNIIFSDSNTHYRGAEDYRRLGEVDALRPPKDGWYAHCVMWDNWSLGWGEQSKQFFTFPNVTWEAMELQAYGYSDGKQVLLDTRTTSRAPAAIRLSPQVAPEASSPTEQTSPSSTLRWWTRSASESRLLSTKSTLLSPEKRLMLRSTTQAGKVTLRAESNGLDSASITISTNAISMNNGLSTFIPGQDLQPNLSRGPTPSGESYVVSRRAIEVLNVKAGTDQGNTTASFDVNEETTWRSDSGQDTAWIEYSWDSSVNISQLVMKLQDFNSEYPITVSVGDNVVFEGTTPTSLGYVTLDLNVTVGKNLRIAMDDDSEFGIIEAKSILHQSERHEGLIIQKRMSTFSSNSN
ncbi:hypothetical protein BDV06DRAFT_218950 [Aspergillus oleicola]